MIQVLKIIQFGVTLSVDVFLVSCVMSCIG